MDTIVKQSSCSVILELTLQEVTMLINDIDALNYRDEHYWENVYAENEVDVITTLKHELIDKLLNFVIRTPEIRFYFPETRALYKVGEYNED